MTLANIIGAANQAAKLRPSPKRLIDVCHDSVCWPATSSGSAARRVLSYYFEAEDCIPSIVSAMREHGTASGGTTATHLLKNINLQAQYDRLQTTIGIVTEAKVPVRRLLVGETLKAMPVSEVPGWELLFCGTTAVKVTLGQLCWAERKPRATDPIHANDAAWPARFRVSRLSLIQAALGLPIQGLADVLRISRVQLYKWLDPTNDISLHETSRKRLEVIERLAMQWRNLSRAPIGALWKEPLSDFPTLQALLTAEDIIEAEVAAALRQLSEYLARKASEAPKRRFTRRASHRALPSDE